jgi:5-amino-6-(5-phosphoribosylamino)uracil reductase
MSNEQNMSREFEQFAAARTDRAIRAEVATLVTDEDRSSGRNLLGIGNAWTRAHYGGDFYLLPQPAARPSLSLVFVRSREGNTGADNPADLGGGETDLHLIYEGLSRVAADAVLAGSATARGHVFFSVWHPALVSLRLELGLPRHPTQIVVTREGNLDPDATLLFNVPEVPVLILAGPQCHDSCVRSLTERPWVTVIPIQEQDLDPAFCELNERGIRRISVVGGRSTASALVDAGIVQDLCLTTTEKSAGQPGTPLYAGSKSLKRELLIRKHWLDPELQERIRFEHFAVPP